MMIMTFLNGFLGFYPGNPWGWQRLFIGYLYETPLNPRD
jgi:hypothetical protein